MPQMTPERWQRVTALLDEVLPHAPDQRQKLLVELCQGDDELRAEIESLLRYEEQCVSLLEEPLAPPPRHDPTTLEAAAGTGEAAAEADDVGLRIGPYRVIRRLGAGGMGTVYLAAREDDFRKRVALKRIKRRVLSEEVRFRFENERQILADLEHPNIARILDAGKTEDQLPYFAMEYVEGRPIDRYCDRRQLNVRQRIELVLEVCSALHLAHQNLVVHRDLKPGNILVNSQGVPKLIDFGIAKHLEPSSVPHDVATRLGTQPMTLKYASPEQLWGLSITTAADIYSLGVLIYQLLTGHDPYPFDQGLAAMHHSICELEPVRPSAAVGRSLEVQLSEHHRERRTPESVSRARGTTPDRLKSALAGDLDGILLKALRKKPANRYRSVEQLAADLRRHLEGLPVSACEGTFRYLTGKFVRRHTIGLVLAGAIMVALAGIGLAVARSEQAKARAERTVDLLESVIEVFNPDEAGNKVTPLAFLNRTRQQLTEDLKSDPELLADLLSGSLRRMYSRLGHQEEALAALEEALVILRTLHPGDHPKIAETLLNQGTNLIRLGDYQRGEERSRDALEMRRRLGMTGAALAAPLGNLATVLALQGKHDEAARRYEEVLEVQRQYLGTGSPESGQTLRNLATLEMLRGDEDRAERLLRQAREIVLETHGPTSLKAAELGSTRGRILHAQGRLAEAEKELMTALEVRRRKLDLDHADIARTERNLAAVLIEIGELDTARALLDHAQPALRREKPPGDWEIAEIEGLLGGVMTAQGLYREAESCLIASYRTIEASRGPETIYTQQAIGRLVQLYEKWNKPARAAEYRALLHFEQNG